MTAVSARRRRHPCEVTADRLGDHVEKYFDQLSGEERDDISRVIFALDRIAEEADQ